MDAREGGGDSCKESPQKVQKCISCLRNKIVKMLNFLTFILVIQLKLNAKLRNQ